MGLKILHSADWHLDTPFTGFSGDQQAYLKAQLRQIPEKAADLCRRESCDLCCWLVTCLMVPIPKKVRRS